MLSKRLHTLADMLVLVVLIVALGGAGVWGLSLLVQRGVARMASSPELTSGRGALSAPMVEVAPTPREQEMRRVIYRMDRSARQTGPLAPEDHEVPDEAIEQVLVDQP